MKPAPFEYVAPRSLEEAVVALGQAGEDAKILAGGQSLIPAMNFRLAQPTVLIDLNRVAELAYVDADGKGVRIGAMARQRAVETSALIAERAPLVRETMPNIAHVQIRNRGTFGGSVAHADPASELPAVVIAREARLKARGPRGEREIAASAFFQGLMSTALEPDELLVEVAFDAMPKRAGWAFTEIARRHGDYALIGVAVYVEVGLLGKCKQARIVFLSAGDAPVVAEQAAAILVGNKPIPEAIEQAANAAADRDIDPPNDVHASATFRRHLARRVASQALTTAFSRV